MPAAEKVAELADGRDLDLGPPVEPVVLVYRTVDALVHVTSTWDISGSR
jgi:hypothetical protein